MTDYAILMESHFVWLKQKLRFKGCDIIIIIYRALDILLMSAPLCAWHFARFHILHRFSQCRGFVDSYSSKHIEMLHSLRSRSSSSGRFSELFNLATSKRRNKTIILRKRFETTLQCLFRRLRFALFTHLNSNEFRLLELGFPLIVN